jgi:hypothetical protein
MPCFNLDVLLIPYQLFPASVIGLHFSSLLVASYVVNLCKRSFLMRLLWLMMGIVSPFWWRRWGGCWYFVVGVVGWNDYRKITFGRDDGGSNVDSSARVPTPDSSSWIDRDSPVDDADDDVNFVQVVEDRRQLLLLLLLLLLFLLLLPKTPVPETQ